MKLYIENETYQKIMHWVDKSDHEVSGLGLIEIVNGEPYVVDVFLLDQENNGTSTDIKPDDLGKLEYKYRDKLLRFWWHSHVNMGVFWSGTDHDTIKQLGSQEGGWFLHTVFNKKREMRSAYSGTQNGMYVFVDQLETEIIENIDPTKIEAWDNEYTEKVKAKVYESHLGRTKYLKYNQEMLPLQQYEFQNRKDVIAEVLELIDSKWSNQEIYRYMGDELTKFKVVVKHVRENRPEYEMALFSGVEGTSYYD